MQIRPREILHYTTTSGRNPYRQWYTQIKDQKTKIRISNRISRLRLGNYEGFKGIIRMSTDIKLQQCTTPFKDYLLKDLVEPEFAKGYLESALQDFDEDGNIEALLLSIKDIAEAEGGTERLVNWTEVDQQTLAYLLNANNLPQLNEVLDIFSKLKDSLHTNHAVINQDSTM